MKTTQRTQLIARLQPARHRHLTGQVEYGTNAGDGSYRLDAEVTVPFEDFEALGLDPEGGFDDEEVVLTLPQLAVSFAMSPARITRDGVIFAAEDAGSGLRLHVGDAVVVRIHAHQVAVGQF
jgi:hypothetical protein